MRSLVVLLALQLLAGCGLLRDMPPAPEGLERDGYVLACEGVATQDCTREADHVAGGIGPGPQLRRIIIRPDGHEACWQGLLQADCEVEMSGFSVERRPEFSPVR